MNPSYVHLLINAIPVLGTLTGLILLAYGLVKSSRRYDRESYMVFMISSIGTIVTYISGFWIMDAIETPSNEMMESIQLHQYIAQGAIASMIILGLTSFYAYRLSSKGHAVSNTLNYVLLGIAFVSLAITLSTSMQGINIHYPIN
ncbi:hypothetical protein [Echinicola salinicaeni]|uniref:hypothetical protein n=1 Tax=Echinicola salinicaeni TaxID=2762757 RepID=UPI001644F6C7|nr:hypothetical protein [Echinicola salinicaeni]